MRLPLVVIKYTHYEYWPWWLFYTPLLPYWLWLAVKNKSLAYFSAANPGIELGGFFGESKSGILSLISEEYKAKSWFVPYSTNTLELKEKIIAREFTFPLIAKPDVGERGNQVTKIETLEQLIVYHQGAKGSYIIQEFIDYDIELGVLYSRMPDSESGMVSSVTLKKFMAVTGDGQSTIKQLMEKQTRTRFQIKRFEIEHGGILNNVIRNGEYKLLEPIGNHCRGTEFIDNNFLINQQLHSTFDRISKPIKGFYYGRFDLKVKSIADLYKGTNIKIMELNGASSEPGHIYDAGKHNIFKAYKDLMWHWKRLAEISGVNIKSGLKPVPFKAIVQSYWKFVVTK